MIYNDKKIGSILIRTFSAEIDPNELKWHRDPEHRIIVPLMETDWKIQIDDNLPIEINGPINIPCKEWHRLIKGTGDLTLKIMKFCG